jgi:hypothetical protein
VDIALTASGLLLLVSALVAFKTGTLERLGVATSSSNDTVESVW